VTINVTDSIANIGGVIDGGNGRTVLVAGQDIVNRGGSIAGGSVALQAGRYHRGQGHQCGRQTVACCFDRSMKASSGPCGEICGAHTHWPGLSRSAWRASSTADETFSPWARTVPVNSVARMPAASRGSERVINACSCDGMNRTYDIVTMKGAQRRISRERSATFNQPGNSII
jgi:hypothetical protein